MIGQTLANRYQITTLLGEGAMGEVYRATDAQTGHEVAIKVITQKLALDAEMLARFRREGEALRHLRHANIVAFVEMFAVGKQQAIVMEYVPAGSLARLIQRGPLPVEQSVRIALELSDALAQAHHINIIHRDIKPDNVLMAEDGRPKLTDFGVARLVSGGTAKLTSTGMQMGTPYYMSPEAWEGKELNEQTDIWSLGVVLYEMLAGQVPFAGDTLVAVMNKVLTAPPPDLSRLRGEVPPALVRVVQRMLTRDQTKRYASMREVALALERVAKEEVKSRVAEATRVKESQTRLTASLAAKTVAEPEPKAGGQPWKWVAVAGVIGVVVLLLIGVAAAGGIGLWVANRAGAPLRATQTALMADLLRLTTTPPPTAALPSATALPSQTPLKPTETPRPSNTPAPTETPLPSATAAPSLTFTPEPTQPPPSSTPRPKAPAATVRPAGGTCTIQALWSDDVYPNQAGYQVQDGTLPWGNSRVTCGSQVFTTSRPNLPPLSLPAGCSLFGEGISVGAAGDWWGAIGYRGQASLGINCRGVIDRNTFNIEVVGGDKPKPYGGYGAAILVPPKLSGASPLALGSPWLGPFSLAVIVLSALMLVKLGRVRPNGLAIRGWMAGAASDLAASLKPLEGWTRLVYKMLGLL